MNDEGATETRANDAQGDLTLDAAASALLDGRARPRRQFGVVALLTGCSIWTKA